MSKLSPTDAGFLLTESHQNPKHVGGLTIQRLPKGKNTAWLRRQLADLKSYEPGFPFNQRVNTSNPLQPELIEDSQFDIDYHVRHTVLPSPGTDEQLMELVSRLHMNLLDRERPLWEFHLIEGLSDRRFAFYTKVHHALADGITFGRWFWESASVSPDDRDTPPIWHRDEEPREHQEEPGYVELLIDGLKTLGGGVRTAISLSALSGRLLNKRFLQGNQSIALPLDAPRTPLNVSVGAARSLSISEIPLEEIRAVGKAFDASINDVVLAISDLAINRYFKAHDYEPEGPLVAYMPINLRDKKEQAEMKEGNLISLLQIRLSSEHDDPLDTLEQVQYASRSAREVFKSATRPAIQTYALFVALVSVAEETLGIGKLLPPVSNIVVSNVSGVRQRLYFRGAEVLSAYPVTTLAPMTALNVTACSYAGVLYFGLIAARTVIPDLPLLNRLMLEAYEEFRERADV